jgi:hypothetical protein
MSSPYHRKSHAVAWVLSILAAFVVYLLSVSPIYYSFQTARPSGPAPVWFDTCDRWIDAYSEPHGWMIQHTFLGRPLHAYDEWVLSIITAK